MTNVVFIAVIAVRLLVPLLIPRFPLPAVVAALVLDAADQTVMAFFDAEPDNYQQFDKALDVYYLTIAYLSTLRNWPDGFAFRISQFLWYYRLLGVAAFELTEVRGLLLIFPNTFEFFFIFYEIVRVCWEPANLPRKVVAGVAVSIWVFIKLPQEFWVHVLQLDATTFLLENPGVLVALVVALVLGAVYVNHFRKTLPPADWEPSFKVDAHSTTVVGEAADPPSGAWALINHPLFEKTVLVGLVIIIFLQLIEDNDAGVVEVIVGVGAIVIATSFVELWVGNRWGSVQSSVISFVCSGAGNTALVVLVGIVPIYAIDRDLGELFTWFLLALLTLIITMYDRNRTLRFDSFEERRESALSPTQPLP